MLIDTHAHLAMDPLYPVWQQVVEEAILHGVDAMVVPGTDFDTSKRAVELATEEPRIVAAVGIHPENTLGDVIQLASIARHPRVAAIGEIGLDYFRFPAGSDQNTIITNQRTLFSEQLQLARELDLPVLIHLRTEQAMRDALHDIKSVYGSHSFQGVFHCFTGSIAFYNEIAHWNICIGAGGMMTYTHQQKLQEVIAQIPLERIVLETDAPFLAPSPLPKGQNTPSNVTISACKLAQLKGVTLMDVLEITGKNALHLFPQLNRL